MQTILGGFIITQKKKRKLEAKTMLCLTPDCYCAAASSSCSSRLVIHKAKFLPPPPPPHKSRLELLEKLRVKRGLSEELPPTPPPNSTVPALPEDLKHTTCASPPSTHNP